MDITQAFQNASPSAVEVMDITKAFINASSSVAQAVDLTPDEILYMSSSDIKMLPPTGPPPVPRCFLQCIQKLGFPLFSTMSHGRRK